MEGTVGFDRWAGSFPALLRDERGTEQMEYLVLLAGVVLPLVLAARLMWAVLLYYFGLESFVVNFPLF